jgi:hypothetical protein
MIRRLLVVAAFVFVAFVTLTPSAAADNCDIFINPEDCQNTGWTIGTIATVTGGVAVATLAVMTGQSGQVPTAPPPVPQPPPPWAGRPPTPRRERSDDEPSVEGVSVHPFVGAPVVEVRSEGDPGNVHFLGWSSAANPVPRVFRRHPMQPNELGRGTTAREVFGDGNDAELLTAMRARMPRRGIAEARLARRPPMEPASYRLLNGRVLEHALGFLNEDVSAPLLAGLSKYRALTQAARDTLADPGRAEVLVTLVDPCQVTSTQKPYIALVAGDTEIARVPFELTLVFGMFGTAVAVRRGAIEGVEGEVCSLTATLVLEGWDPPLLQRTLRLPVRLPVRPPVPIPLPPQAGGR